MTLNSLLMKKLENVKYFYASADMNMVIASSIFSVSMVLTTAILSQGSKNSIFRQGLQLWGGKNQKEDESQVPEENTETEMSKSESEESEQDQPQENEPARRTPRLKRRATMADPGIDIVMQSIVPTLALAMLLIVVISACHIALSSSSA